VRLYTLEVFLMGGPISEKFAKKNPVISRTIQIRGDQTLEDLHHAIFDAFDRFDEHMYEFQFGKGPMDRKAPRYVLPNADDLDMGDGKRPAGRVEHDARELALAVQSICRGGPQSPGAAAVRHSLWFGNVEHLIPLGRQLERTSPARPLDRAGTAGATSRAGSCVMGRLKPAT